MEAWSNENSPNFRETANKLRRELELIRSTHDHLSYASITNILLQDDMYWKQRAKIYWLTDRDKNSKFFHASASARNKRNAIKKLRDTNDILVKDQTGLCNIAQSYFQNLFVPNHGDHAPIVATISQRVTYIDNQMLIALFTEEEFRQAAFSMHPDKFLGPDGLNPGFYRKFWPLFGREFFEACCSWLEDGQIPHNINDTNIALVAKVDRPESMKDLRHISLCNVVYKILSKVLANRLKRILPTCI
jgi:hypothetical protein